MLTTKGMRWAVGALAVLALGAGATRAEAQANVSGVVFAQYGYMFSDTAHFNSFDVTRAYVNVRAKFDHGIATRVTSDIYRDANGSYNFRLKYAYVAWTPDKSPITFRFGQTQTPWLDWQEGLWGYRVQGPMMVDRAHFLTSSDIGLAVDGTFNDHAFDFQTAFVNGEGYHAPEGDKGKSLEARASVRLIKSDEGGSRGGLRATLYGGVGSPVGGGVRNRLIAELSYKSKMVTLAGEFGSMSDRKGTETAANPTVDARVLGAFGVLNIPQSPVSVIARVDHVDPNTSASNDAHTIVIAGVSYTVSNHLMLLGDLDLTSYQGTPTPAQDAARNKGYFQVQFTF